MPAFWLRQLPAVFAVVPTGAAFPGRLACSLESLRPEWQDISVWLWETNAISDTVSPSFRFLWANLIRSDLFAVLYSAAISSETGSASGISTLAGNSLMTYLLIECLERMQATG